MNSVKWIISAFAIVAFVTAAGNGFFLNGFAIGDVSAAGEANLLNAGLRMDGLTNEEAGEFSSEEILPEAVGLEVFPGNNGGSLGYSTQAEMYRFVLDANAPYALRYVSFQVGFRGLQSAIGEAGNWKLYSVVDGQVDYLNQVGVGESLNDGVLKVRLSSDRGAAYQGRAGETKFALATSVLRNPNSDDEPWLSVSMPAAGWAWVPGFYDGAWLALEDSYGAEFVGGLPGEVVERK